MRGAPWRYSGRPRGAPVTQSSDPRAEVGRTYHVQVVTILRLQAHCAFTPPLQSQGPHSKPPPRQQECCDALLKVQEGAVVNAAGVRGGTASRQHQLGNRHKAGVYMASSPSAPPHRQGHHPPHSDREVPSACSPSSPSPSPLCPDVACCGKWGVGGMNVWADGGDRQEAAEGDAPTGVGGTGGNRVKDCARGRVPRAPLVGGAEG